MTGAQEQKSVLRPTPPAPGERPAVEDQPDSADKVHFPGLNGLRFIAAFSVLLYHVEAFKSMAQLPSWVSMKLWQSLGPYGVVCFFTLSGFLITYLLLVERDRIGTIRVRKFYLRRILRIWPLYYLVVLLGFLALPLASSILVHPQAQLSGNFLERLPLFIFFLPNLAWIVYGIIPFAGPLWSVGVEEQFYLLWPILLRLLGGRTAFGILLVIVVMVSLRFALPMLGAAFSSGPVISRDWQIAMGFLWTLKLECMAAGALAAYALHGNFRRILAFLHHPLTQIGAIALIIASLGLGLRYRQFDNLVWGTAFAVLILNLASNPRSLIKLRGRVLNYLGRISFGIYVYHSFVIAGLLLILRNLMPMEGFLFNFTLYSSATLLTIVIAGLSHRYYESPFLRLKARYMVVPSSGESASPAAQQKAPKAR
ncbi:MAG: acyltransferase [Myxococcota bacterium]|nr:acyltransferase [Myxococcota bacterium]